MTPLPLRRLCLVAMAVLTWSASAAPAQVPDRLVGRIVREAQLRSAGQAVRDAQLEGLIEIQRGQPLEMAAVRETIVHLMGMGRYIDVQVSAFEDGDGVRVEIDLVPLRDVRRIVFTGELGLPERTLRESVVDRFGSTPSTSRAADVARALEELLANHGFLRAKVDRPEQEAAAADGDLVFHVAAGARALVRTVSYQGRRPGGRPGPAGPRAARDRVVLRSRANCAAASTRSPNGGGRGATTRPGPTPRSRSRQAATPSM